MLKLKNGDRARIIEKITENLCGYGSADYPDGTYMGFDLYINLESGQLYAIKK